MDCLKLKQRNEKSRFGCEFAISFGHILTYYMLNAFKSGGRSSADDQLRFRRGRESI
jgi:hypothetical protein